MKLKRVIISKGKKAKVGPVHTRDITLGDLWECFFPPKGEEYSYLGYAWYHVPSDGSIWEEGRVLIEFFKEVERVARPWWCPRFFLRMLDLFGNDRSIVRMRSYRLNRLFSRITRGVRITDTKWKFDSFRIYGSFTEELERKAEETCRKIEATHFSDNPIFV
jgi:hypothetical protein